MRGLGTACRFGWQTGGVTLVLLALVTATVLAFVFRGRPSIFTRPGLNRTGLLGIVLVSLLTSPLAKSVGVYAGWLVVGALALVWFFARNRGRPGVGLAIVGLAANAVVIMLNSGMPVSVEAIERAGVPTSRWGDVPEDAELTEEAAARAHLDADPLRNELTTETVLPWLGEAVPLALPLRPAVSSPGDVLIAAGAALFMFTGLTGRGRSVPDRLLGTKELKKLRKKEKAAQEAAGQTGDQGAEQLAPADAAASLVGVLPGGSAPGLSDGRSDGRSDGPIGWDPPPGFATDRPPNWWSSTTSRTSSTTRTRPLILTQRPRPERPCEPRWLPRRRRSARSCSSR